MAESAVEEAQLLMPMPMPMPTPMPPPEAIGGTLNRNVYSSMLFIIPAIYAFLTLPYSDVMFCSIKARIKHTADSSQLPDELGNVTGD
jgi:hypothetical protein